MAGSLKWFGKQVDVKTIMRTATVLTKGAIMVTNEIKKLMREPKSGKVYKGKQFKTRSAAAGEAPAVQTGRLRASIHYESPEALTRLIGTNIDYGYFLEVGTSRTGGKAYPFLRPAFKNTVPKVVRMLRNLI